MFRQKQLNFCYFSLLYESIKTVYHNTMLVFNFLKPWLRSYWKKKVNIRSLGIDRALCSEKSNQCFLTHRVDFIIHCLLLTDGCPWSWIEVASFVPQRPNVPKQNYSVWGHSILVQAKLVWQNQKFVHHSLVALSVGPDKMHIGDLEVVVIILPTYKT